jgi:hypothetical protein
MSIRKKERERERRREGYARQIRKGARAPNLKGYLHVKIWGRLPSRR